MKGGKSEGEMNHERLWTLGIKLRILKGNEVGEFSEPNDGY